MDIFHLGRKKKKRPRATELNRIGIVKKKNIEIIIQIVFAYETSWAGKKAGRRGQEMRQWFGS